VAFPNGQGRQNQVSRMNLERGLQALFPIQRPLARRGRFALLRSPRMSFWDHVKPAKRPPTATAVDLSPDQQVITLTWDDGKQTRVSARTLRQHCPCAECVEEWTGKRTFDIEQIPQGMKFIEMSPVGNYALTFTFSDAHRIGIYNWSHLRELSEKYSA
jgi:DUF971 family protein